MAKAKAKANWATLPVEMLVCIAESLEFIDEYVRFCAVCKSWQKVQPILENVRTFRSRYPYVMLTDIAEKNYPEITRTLHPYDMLVQEVQKNEYVEGMNKRRFYSLETSRTCEIELPEATRRKCLGVGYSWLLTVGYDLQINLLHPFTRRQIGMPPLSSFKNHYESDPDDEYETEQVVSMFVEKAVMSSDPDDDRSNQDCVILAIYGMRRGLAFARPGDEVWTDIPVHVGFGDVVYYKGSFYAVDCNSDKIFVVDIDGENGPKITCISRITDVNYAFGHDKTYLVVESSGSLLVVFRIRPGRYNHDWVLPEEPWCTKDFSIYRMEEYHDAESTSKYPYRFREMESLGEQSLFLGYNASVSLPSSKCIKANCIYFSEDNAERYERAPFGGGSDTGIFDVENKTITPHYAAEFKSHLTPPIWFI